MIRNTEDKTICYVFATNSEQL